MGEIFTSPKEVGSFGICLDVKGLFITVFGYIFPMDFHSHSFTSPSYIICMHIYIFLISNYCKCRVYLLYMDPMDIWNHLHPLKKPAICKFHRQILTLDLTPPTINPAPSVGCMDGSNRRSSTVCFDLWTMNQKAPSCLLYIYIIILHKDYRDQTAEVTPNDGKFTWAMKKNCSFGDV